jgi:hypothetical protein
MKKDFNIKAKIDSFSKDLSDLKKLSILREFESQHDRAIYKINVSYTQKKTQKGLLIELFAGGNVAITDSFIKFDKLKSLAAKILLSNSLPSLSDLTSITSLNHFLKNIFIYHIFINKNGDGLSIGVLSRPIGVCNSFHEVVFMKNKCIVDIHILSNKEIRFFIYSSISESQHIFFDFEFDESSYKLVFTEIVSSRFSDDEEVKRVPSYKLVNDKHLGKNGFVQYILLKIQNILKNKLQDENTSFDSMYKLLKDTNMKISVQDELNYFSLWIVTSNDFSNYVLEFYALNKILCKLY